MSLAYQEAASDTTRPPSVIEISVRNNSEDAGAEKYRS